MVGLLDVGALVIATVGRFVGDAVVIMMGARVVGMFVGELVGGRMGASVGAIGVRVGVREGAGVVGVLVATTGAGETLISGSSMTKSAGNTIPPLNSTDGTTVNWSMVGKVSSSPQQGTGSSVIIQHRMINMKFECRIKQ